MYFPVAGIELNPLIPPATAFIISFFTSMAGVSGAFLLLPIQVSLLGFTTPAVSATNHLFNITAIPSGIYRFIREDRMIWPLTWLVILGTLPGVMGGAIIRIKLLPDPEAFKIFAGLVLLYIGVKLVRDLMKKGRTQSIPKPDRPSSPFPTVTHTTLTRKTISYQFAGQLHQASTPGIFCLSLIVGLIGGIYGIGGGAIIAPFFVTIYRLPIHTVAGATLMGTFTTSAAGVVLFQMLDSFFDMGPVAPDYLLGILFGIGGAAGIYCGARMQRYFPARIIKTILATCILFTAASYLIFR
ncbi:MAG: sulfite exporter TauE/SafE family protein [Desulfobulbaceae bacterium]|uniref:Probable membrane transporter protein n=1 Tax=Candidatus Desulfatifera sulfidica TaxID=2841691 RepID=A0A8J6TE59_9BACT|nr:sulfite exporter TauE/SafE family protein [Candidatus Desulfatifera sulfidica]